MWSGARDDLSTTEPAAVSTIFLFSLKKSKAMKYRSKETIEAVSFQELVEIALAADGTNIVNGVPWSFKYQGWQFTHESDDLYLFSIAGETVKFRRGDFLATDVTGALWLMSAETINDHYYPAAYGEIESNTSAATDTPETDAATHLMRNPAGSFVAVVDVEVAEKLERSRDDAMKNVEVIAESHKWCSIRLEKLEAAVKPLAAACYRLTDTDDWRGVAKILVACHTLMDTHPELFPENRELSQPPVG